MTSDYGMGRIRISILSNNYSELSALSFPFFIFAIFLTKKRGNMPKKKQKKRRNLVIIIGRKGGNQENKGPTRVDARNSFIKDNMISRIPIPS